LFWQKLQRKKGKEYRIRRERTSGIDQGMSSVESIIGAMYHTLRYYVAVLAMEGRKSEKMGHHEIYFVVGFYYNY